MESQKKLILKGDWKILIILDACRFDYFKDVYENYLDGSLRKVESPGSHTTEWCEKVLKEGFPDVVYFSANPTINSLGIERLNGFDAREYFHEVVDVWDFGWNDEKKTVEPSTLTKVSENKIEDYPDKSMILHYNQPHTPYLSYGYLKDAYKGSKGRKNTKKNNNSDEDSILEKIKRSGGNFVVELLGKENWWRVRDFFGLLPPDQMSAVVLKDGKSGLKKAYEENLKIVLENISNSSLVKNSEKCIITSDQGELLGENGEYFHFYGSDNPLLKEVPWLEVES